MAKYWNFTSRQRRLEMERKRRLATKAQKAGATTRLTDIIEQHHSWNRRFGAVARMRAGNTIS